MGDEKVEQVGKIRRNKRERVALQIMLACAQNPNTSILDLMRSPDTVAKQCYNMADAFIRAGD